jgi:AcrR family transcriptional regulator
MRQPKPAGRDGELEVLPRGRHGLPRHLVQASQRERMLRAITVVVAEKGYAATTVADVVRRARVSRKAFYESYSDKEECFVAACQTGYDAIVARIHEATRAVPAHARPAARLRAATRAYLEFMAEEPQYARTMLIEVVGAGPLALEGRSRVRQRFAAMTRAWHEQARYDNPSYPPVPASAYTAMVAAIYGLVAACVAEGNTEHLVELEEEIDYVQLVVFAGHAVADAELPGVAEPVPA